MRTIDLKFVYQILSENEKQSVIKLWEESQVVSKNEAIKRVNQVSVLLLHNDNTIGVSTIYPHDFVIPNNPYFFFRMFIKKEFRGDNAIRTKLMQLNFRKLKKKYGNHMHGIVIELENKKLEKLGEKSKYFQQRGYTYQGKSPRGLQLWYVRFDEPKGIFT